MEHACDQEYEEGKFGTDREEFLMRKSAVEEYVRKLIKELPSAELEAAKAERLAAIQAWTEARDDEGPWVPPMRWVLNRGGSGEAKWAFRRWNGTRKPESK